MGDEEQISYTVSEICLIHPNEMKDLVSSIETRCREEHDSLCYVVQWRLDSSIRLLVHISRTMSMSLGGTGFPGSQLMGRDPASSPLPLAH